MPNTNTTPNTGNETAPQAEAKPKGPIPMAERLKDLAERRKAIELGGGQARLDRQHEQNKLSARERVDALLDRGSFQEQYGFAQHRCTFFGMEGKELPADGVVTGCGPDRTDDSSTLPARTSPSPAARSARSTATRSST
jgi:acetyl-CoA carboxylase carboxyltransferase component